MSKAASRKPAQPTEKPRAIPSGSTAAAEFYQTLARMVADSVVAEVRAGKARRKVRLAWPEEAK
jgi:hypothetical protein